MSLISGLLLYPGLLYPGSTVYAAMLRLRLRLPGFYSTCNWGPEVNCRNDPGQEGGGVGTVFSCRNGNNFWWGTKPPLVQQLPGVSTLALGDNPTYTL